MKNSEKTLDMIVNLCKNRGYVYAGSEIYGGLANSWDYGPLGVEFKNNVKKAWLKKFVQESDYNVGLDAAIIMNPQTWVTTGHVGNFSDPLVDCKGCGARQRADKLIGFKIQGEKTLDVRFLHPLHFKALLGDGFLDTVCCFKGLLIFTAFQPRDKQKLPCGRHLHLNMVEKVDVLFDDFPHLRILFLREPAA